MIFGVNPLLISAVLFNALLLIAYFSKRRIRSVENKIYDVMVATSFLGTLIGIFTYLIVAKYYMLPSYLLIIAKVYLLYLVIWGTAFCLYNIYISIKDSMIKKWKIIRNCIILISTFFSVAIMLLPIDYVSENGEVYTSGLSVNLTYIY